MHFSVFLFFDCEMIVFNQPAPWCSRYRSWFDSLVGSCQSFLKCHSQITCLEHSDKGNADDEI